MTKRDDMHAILNAMDAWEEDEDCYPLENTLSISLAEYIRPLLVQAREEGKAEERERCCAAICPHCADGVPVVQLGGEWWHQRIDYTPAGDRRDPCEAQAIREEVDAQDPADA